MSDIGLKGVAGLIVIGGTTLLLALIALIATIVAVGISSRRALPIGPAFARLAAGPMAATATAAVGLAWAWDGPSEAVDRLAPVLALGSLIVGVIVGVLVRRSSRGQPNPLPPR